MIVLYIWLSALILAARLEACRSWLEVVRRKGSRSRSSPHRLRSGHGRSPDKESGGWDVGEKHMAFTVGSSGTDWDEVLR